jgi:UDP-4-amino-4-deoxy-L-arabinose-oxoglutarate aminotransferase
MRIPHSASDVGDAEARAIAEAVARNRLGYGDASLALERALLQRTCRSFGYAVLSGSHALALAIAAADLAPGSLIALPVLTCTSVLQAVLNAGHVPVLVDIREDDLTLDVARIPSNVALVIAPHAYGAPVDINALARIGLPWIEDCATSPATRAAGRPAGSFGSLAVFSFGATKYITGGSGGLVATDDPQMAERLRVVLDERPRMGAFRHPARGAMAGRLASLNAAVALTQLHRIDELRRRRHAIARRYLEAFPTLAPRPFDDAHGYYRLILRVDEPAPIIADSLQRRGIDARCSVNPWLDDHFGEPHPEFMGARSWKERLLSLPIHPTMAESDVDFVIDVVSESVASASRYR